MAATTAVLETYELLENIISHLSARNVMYVVRVSKAWKKIACSSKIEQQNALAPSYNIALRGKNGSSSDGYPIYSHHAQLRFHPRFRIWSDIDGFNLDFYLGALKEPNGGLNTPLDLDDCLNSFISSPPCQAIRLELWGWSGRHYSSCIVYVKRGIRIKDVLDVASGMRRPVASCSVVRLAVEARVFIQREGSEAAKADFRDEYDISNG